MTRERSMERAGAQKTMAVKSPRGSLVKMVECPSIRIISHLATASNMRRSITLPRRPCDTTLHLIKEGYGKYC